MREIGAEVITDTVAQMCIDANYLLPCSLTNCLKAAKENERFHPAQGVLSRLLQNGDEAAKGIFPVCQDTGFVCVFIEIGQEVHIKGNLEDAVNEGVRRGYDKGYLRNSMVNDPLRRKNTGDNTPAMLTVSLCGGKEIKLTVAPKGIGSENMSRIAMLTPSHGEEGVLRFVIETVQLAAANPCPPIVVGIGIGGSFDKAPLLAKRALLREIGVPNEDSYYAQLESRILREINKLGIGPAGLGGDTTALAVHINPAPTHMAALPVAVNLNCHVTRHKTIII